MFPHSWCLYQMQLHAAGSCCCAYLVLRTALWCVVFQQNVCCTRYLFMHNLARTAQAAPVRACNRCAPRHLLDGHTVAKSVQSPAPCALRLQACTQIGRPLSCSTTLTTHSVLLRVHSFTRTPCCTVAVLAYIVWQQMLSQHSCSAAAFAWFP